MRNLILCAAAATLACSSTKATVSDAGVACPGSYTVCGEVCANLTVDANNCGACGTACAQGQQCNGGHCACPSPTPNACGAGGAAFCTSFQTDPNNCGACGTACAADQQCSAGHCVHGCPSGATGCPAAAPAYCSNLQTDAQNCGACGAACPLPGESCVNGACVCGFAQITEGRTFACAVKSGGTVSCWGQVNVGDSSAASSTDGIKNGQSFGGYSPFTVQGLSGVKKVAASGATLCALKTDGTVWCLGGNAKGQLGNNDTTGSLAAPAFAPTQVQLLAQTLDDGGVVPTAFLTGATDLAGAVDPPADNGNSEAAFCALTSNGVWCWGGNGNAELGDGTTHARAGAVQVQNLPEGTTFKQLALRQDLSCALATDGNVWCWGNGDSGGEISGPHQIDGIANATQLTAGSGHDCAIEQDGSLWCWGDNGSGQLGNGNTSGGGPLQVQTGPAVTLDDGGVEPPPFLTGVTAAGGGGSWTCASTGAQVWCWGSNSKGETGLTLPDGGAFTSLVAAQVLGVSGLTSIAGGHLSTCGVKSDGTAFCWGGNARGQVGIGQPVYRVPKPLQVAGCQ